MMRLDKYLSDATAYSRREIRTLVSRKSVTVNNMPAKAVDMKVNENTDLVCINGQSVVYRKFIYLMLNKPQGYLSATEDDRDPVVVDLLPEEYKHFAPFPVGRLDKDTEGLLLLTNDGQFDHRLMAPGKKVFKRYFVRLAKAVAPEAAAAVEAGIDLGDFTTAPGKLHFTSVPQEVFIDIAEGKFHQVKRMFAALDNEVVFLRRTAIGGLQLDPALKPGECRELTADECIAAGSGELAPCNT
jgi:16S rRNA pseudouridine516 synthase